MEMLLRILILMICLELGVDKLYKRADLELILIGGRYVICFDGIREVGCCCCRIDLYTLPVADSRF
jgi:hypothetical protein